jgi:hypothetical protein
MKKPKPVLKYLAALSVSSMAVVNTLALGTVDENPSAFLTIGTELMTLQYESTEGGFQIPKGTIVKTEEGQVTFTDGVQFNTDPSIAYGFAVIDFGAPSVFGFSFATPIVATPSPTLVASTLVGGLTDFTDNGISLTPGGPDVQVNSVSSSGIGGPYVNMGVDLGAAFAAPSTGVLPAIPHAYPYGPFIEGLIPGPAGGPWDALKVDIFFGLSGAVDIAALTGSATIIDAPPTVPEGGAGIAGVAAIGALLIIGGRKLTNR